MLTKTVEEQLKLVKNVRIPDGTHFMIPMTPTTCVFRRDHVYEVTIDEKHYIVEVLNVTLGLVELNGVDVGDFTSTINGTFKVNEVFIDKEL